MNYKGIDIQRPKENGQSRTNTNCVELDNALPKLLYIFMKNIS